MKTKPLEQKIEEILAYYESDGSNITMPKTVEAISNLVEEEVKKARPSEKNISFLRQWLNEDRIADPRRMVTNDMIEHWLFNKHISDLKSNKE